VDNSSVNSHLEKLEENLTKDLAHLFCYIKCIEFPNYDECVWGDTNLEPKGLFDFHEATKLLRRSILEGLSYVRHGKKMLFAERLWLEIYGKVVAQANFIKYRPLEGMFVMLTKYLRPRDSNLQAAYARFQRLNSIETNDPAAQYKRAKRCAVLTLSLLLVQKLRVDEKILSAIQYDEGLSEYTKPNIDKLLSNSLIPTSACSSTHTTECVSDTQNIANDTYEELLKRIDSLHKGCHHDSIHVMEDLHNTSGILDLCAQQQPCSAAFLNTNIRCLSTRHVHSNGWHKSPISYEGQNPDVSFFWGLIVRVGLALKRKVPTYWKGVFLGDDSTTEDTEMFWEYYTKHALGSDMKFLELHNQLIREAVDNLDLKQKRSLQNPVVYEHDVTGTSEPVILCFLCANVMKHTYNTRFCMFPCAHQYCANCNSLPLERCPVCDTESLRFKRSDQQKIDQVTNANDV